VSPANFGLDSSLPQEVVDILNPPYPLETLREVYRAPLGGSSKRLGDDQVGVSVYAFRKERLALTPYTDRVILYIDGKRYVPLLSKNFYVIPLKPDERPQDFMKSLRGEIVIPDSLFQEMWDRGIRLEPGTPLILNGVPNHWTDKTLKRMEAILSKWSKAPPKHVLDGYG